MNLPSVFKLTDVQAYRYITHYKGIDMIDEHYNIMHTLDFDEMVNSLAIYCNRQGGALIWFFFMKTNKAMTDFEYMKEALATELVMLLIEKEGMDMKSALNCFYN